MLCDSFKEMTSGNVEIHKEVKASKDIPAAGSSDTEQGESVKRKVLQSGSPYKYPSISVFLKTIIK